MNKVKLIHNKDKFLLEINNTPIEVSSYKVENYGKEGTELTFKMPIDLEGSSSIDIETQLLKFWWN